MTDFAIQEQIKAIKKSTNNALKSKEAARKFLADAGIIKEKILQNIWIKRKNKNCPTINPSR
jgi:hypothetical protein